MLHIEINNKNISITLSNKQSILHSIGDQPFSPICDYMDSCYYKCVPSFNSDNTIPEDKIDTSTYNSNHLFINNNKILEFIKDLFREKHFYYVKDILNNINIINKNYTLDQISNTIDSVVNNKLVVLHL